MLLAASQIACLVALLWTSRKRYRITAWFLGAAACVTFLYHPELDWVSRWYIVLDLPVTILRFFAGIEIAQRQTEGFRYWWRLMGAVFLMALFGAGVGWVRSSHPDTLQSFVEMRRLLQIYLGAVFFSLEAFWLSQGGGLHRRADHIAVAFGVMAIVRGALGVIAGGHHLDTVTWQQILSNIEREETVVYAALTMLFANARKSSRTVPVPSS